MVSPRWRKVLRDIWASKTRAALIVLSIAVGVFAVGTVVHMHLLVSRDLDMSYASVSPANITLSSTDLFSEELARTVGKLPDVAGVTAQRRIAARFKPGTRDKWYPIELIAIDDYENIVVNKVMPENVFDPDPVKWPPGEWPPPKRGVVLERTALLMGQLGLLQSKLGDVMTIETVDGKRRDLTMAGLAYDFNQLPATFAGRAYGYIDLDTLELFGQTRDFNTLQIIVANHGNDRAYIAEVADRVRRQVERNGTTVASVEVHEPGKLPLDYVFRAIALIVGTLGVVSLALSGFLIINTISALLSQQVRQIGVMKAIGARAHQLVAMYLCMVVVLGLLAVAVAMPLAREGARYFAGFLSFFLNFKMTSFETPPEVIAFELGVGVLIPLLAALYPVLAGTRITVRAAISSNGMSEGTTSNRMTGVFEHVQFLPRPVILSLRNSFRRQGRLLLTLATLIIASATFVSVLSLRASMSRTVDEAFDLWQYDVLVQLTQPYNAQRLERTLQQMPGVSKVESWAEALVYRVDADGGDSIPIALIAPPAATELLQPTLLAGRWLLPSDTNALVVDTQTLKAAPDIALGTTLLLDIHGKETRWQIVGVVQTVGAARFAYANYPYAARLLKQPGRATRVQVMLEARDRDSQIQMAQRIEDLLKQHNVDVTLSRATVELREQSESLFTIITSLLLVMALLMAIVGGLGLMGTMSLNVLERTREIGVMRAVGASTAAILQIVLTEGVVIGLLSWFFGTILALPLGRPLSDAIGMQFFQTPLTYTFSLSGAAIWFGLMLTIALAASYVPARRATEISVRSALAYE